MTSPTRENNGFRRRLRHRLSQFRSRSRHSSNDSSIQLTPSTQADPAPETNSSLISTPIASSLSPDQLSRDNEVHQIGQSTLGGNSADQNTTTHPVTPTDSIDSSAFPSDLWSAAYREAVESLGEELDTAILEGKDVTQLFKDLEDIGKGATEESALLRGVRYLRSIKVPLETFKLTLDLASPPANLELTAATVIGVVRSVTAIAISVASADVAFAKQIAEMLRQISYIDDCDTLGQKGDRKDIHKALVLVYQKILEFYKVAFEILTRKGVKLIMKMVLENDRLPVIVEDFLKYSDSLGKIVQNATLEIVEDIRSMLYDREIASWLGSDKMSRQSQHHADLQKIRSDEACDFLLTNANFINWYRDPNLQRLVVVGEMGSGKTVAMTFLVDELRRRNEHQIPRPKVCCYYCRDDGTGQSIYILSALILSLLTQLPGLKKPFFQWYQEVQASGILYPAADIQKLEEFLQKVLEAVDRPVFIVIDGLDECDQASRNNLLKLLEALTQKIPGLKTILSTRPQEEILEQLDNTARIDMVSDVRRDSIVVEKTVETRLFYLSTDVKALVIERLSRLAQGSAIWTKMIVELIAAEKIRALEPMRSFLAEAPVPEQLSQLYVTLLSRCTLNVPKNLGLARTALKLLAITHRPLSILELSWAATLGTAAQDVTTVAALAQLVDHQKVMSLIHPFIARVDFSDVKKRQVRIIHQSVKEFILKEWTFPENDDMILDQQRVESLEGFVLNICIRYLLLEEIGNKKLFSEEQFAIAELPQEFDLFSDDEEPVEYDPYCSWETWEEDMIRYDPTERGFGEFFVYASCYWLEHFGVVTVEPLPSLASIENLCRAGSTQLFNWTQQNCRPDCAITPRFPFESNLYDPLSITSLYGSEAMLRYMLANSDFDKGSFLSEAAFGAGEQVIQWGAASKLRILFLDEKLGYQLQTLDFFRLLVKSWSYPNANHHDWDVIFDLVNYVLGKLVEEKWGNDLLCLAAGAGCMPIIRRLMASAQGKADLRRELLCEFRIEEEWSEFDKPMHQSIGEAVLGNHVDVVEYLLGENGIEAHLRYRNIHGENVLHLAARLCNPDMFRLLIPRFQEGIHQTDNQGDTALGRVITNSLASGDRLESARTLLSQSGVDWGKHSWDEQRDPLRVAVRLGDFDMCYLLLSIGEMNPLSALDCDSNDQIMGLKDITSENEANMQQILQLLCTHAKVATGSIRDE